MFEVTACLQPSWFLPQWPYFLSKRFWFWVFGVFFSLFHTLFPPLHSHPKVPEWSHLRRCLGGLGGSCRDVGFHELQQNCGWLDWWWYNILYRWASRADASQISNPGLWRFALFDPVSLTQHSDFLALPFSITQHLWQIPWKKKNHLIWPLASSLRHCAIFIFLFSCHLWIVMLVCVILFIFIISQ